MVTLPVYTKARVAAPKEIALEAPTLARNIAEAAADRKGLDIIIIDVRGRTSYTDFIILVSGTSDRHVQALAEGIESDLAQQGERCIGREGLREGQWALVDFAHVMVHVFHAFTRDLYALETMWRDAPQERIASQEPMPQLGQWAASHP